MPCMCGDYCCYSCGPAQGNSRCRICREWVSEGCDHVDEDGNLLPQFAAQAAELDRQDALAEEALDKMEAEWERAHDTRA